MINVNAKTVTNTTNTAPVRHFDDKRISQTWLGKIILIALVMTGLMSCSYEPPEAKETSEITDTPDKTDTIDSTPTERNTSINIFFETDLNSAAKDDNVFQQLELRHLKFYVHNVQLFDDQGKNLGATLANKPPWQTEKGALIKLDTQGEQRNNTLVVNLPSSTYSMAENTTQSTNQSTTQSSSIAAVRFTLGLGFKENHQDPLQAQTPFNVSSMYWSWQLGYKFLRLDLSREERHFNFHLGSTGCVSPAPVRPPQEACARPNLANIELKHFNPLRHTIQFRVNSILEILQPDTPNTHCTGNYQDNNVCSAFVKKIGLSPEQGQCLDHCLGQTIFAVIDKDREIN